MAATAAAAIAAMRAAYDRGDIDEAARRGALAGPAVVERALASSDRTTALAGISAATIVEDRAELLGPLARVAAGEDRRTARGAAEAARAIAAELAHGGPPDDLAPGDLATWQAAWAELALRGDRWIDVRIPALDAAAALDPAGTGVDLEAALRDPEPAFRRAAVSAVRLPVPAGAVTALAGAVTHDADPATALDAAQSLCLSLETSAGPRPVLDALGSAGLTRLRALVARPPAAATSATVRDAARCLVLPRAPRARAPSGRRR